MQKRLQPYTTQHGRQSVLHAQQRPLLERCGNSLPGGQHRHRDPMTL